MGSEGTIREHRVGSRRREQQKLWPTALSQVCLVHGRGNDSARCLSQGRGTHPPSDRLRACCRSLRSLTKRLTDSARTWRATSPNSITFIDMAAVVTLRMGSMPLATAGTSTLAFNTDASGGSVLKRSWTPSRTRRMRPTVTSSPWLLKPAVTSERRRAQLPTGSYGTQTTSREKFGACPILPVGNF